MPPLQLRLPANLPQGMRDARDGTAATRPLSEYGNAMRLYDRHGTDLRYVTDAKAWLIWNGNSWSWDLDGSAVINLASGLAEGIYHEAVGNIHEADVYVKWARKTQELRVAKASVAILASMVPIRISSGMIDNNPMILGMDQARQVLDLASGGIRPAVREDLVTKSIPLAGLGRADGAVRWKQFLNQVFKGDQRLIEWLQRWCGYVLTGDTSEQFFCFAYGHGRNGKGTFTEFIRYILGQYAAPVGLETLTDMRRSGGAAAPDVAALVGLRFAYSSETSDEAALAEGLIKTLTGGDSISTREVYGKQFSFVPQFKLWISGNHKPIIRGTDRGVWSRVRLIPFTRIFEDSEQDRGLKQKLIDEAEHILAWMLEGTLRWQQNGLSDVPDCVEEATKSYREEMDDFGHWLEECCDVSDPKRESVSSVLYQCYKEWAKRSGYVLPMTIIKFTRKMRDRGFYAHKTKKNNCWVGIGIKLPVN